MTNGIVGALGREIEAASGHPIQGPFRPVPPSNPGNSGGPLLDSAGRLIGMNTSILSPSGSFSGIGFAIPVDDINEIVPQLIRHGKVVRPRLGIQLAEDQLAQQLGIAKGGADHQGDAEQFRRQRRACKAPSATVPATSDSATSSSPSTAKK